MQPSVIVTYRAILGASHGQLSIGSTAPQGRATCHARQHRSTPPHIQQAKVAVSRCHHHVAAVWGQLEASYVILGQRLLPGFGAAGEIPGGDVAILSAYR
mgnify:CR=1 FL=1